MRVTSVPVTLAEEDSPHAPGAMGIGKKVVITGNLVSPVGQSPGCSVFSASCRNSGYLQLASPSAERQSRVPSGVEKVTG